MRLAGLHHITLISSDMARTVDFYTRVLGLRLIKQTVNYDDPSAKHFYFGDEVGTPGTVITYFEWPHLPPGRTGPGLTHHYAFTVADERAQLCWLVRLRRLGYQVTLPRPRVYFTSIYFRDPDGVIIEVATRGPGFAVDEDPARLGGEVKMPPREYMKPHRQDREPDLAALDYDGAEILPAMRLASLHHITLMCRDIERTTRFYTDLLGLRLVKRTINFDDPSSPHSYYGDEQGSPGTLVTYFAYPQMAQGTMGVGVTHHYAFAVDDEAEQWEWQARLMRAGIPVSPVMDRTYFRSIYFQDPDGVILEIATRGPGFLVDEPRETLGARMILPGGRSCA
ncbi:MAG: VOC family protein [Armatimonadetes bacterium]|nr:VOC family protein [Armatimonadota bacterium]